MIKKEELSKLKKEAKLLKPVLNVGKSGITEGIIEQLKKDFNTKELVKIKFLRNFLDEKEIKPREAAEQLSKMTGSEVVLVVGLTATLYKKKK